MYRNWKIIAVIFILSLILYYGFYNDESGLNYDASHIIKDIVLGETEKMDHEVLNVVRHRAQSRTDEILAPPCTGLNKDVHPRPELDIWQEGPLSFDKGFVNPCWYGTFGRLQCIPFFYLAGMPKSGTTYLFASLIRHPSISKMSAGHWITRTRFQDKKHTFDWWTGNSSIVKSWSDILRKGNSELKRDILGEGSVSVFWDYSNWPFISGNENCSEPRITNPYLIHHLNPESKIIVIFRNPTDRAYSDFLYFDNSKNTTVEEFHTYCYKSIKIIKECMSKFGDRYCIFNKSITDQMEVRLHVGLYSVFMKEWLNVFNRDRILTLRLQELSENPETVLTRAFDFLGVAPLSTKHLLEITSSERKNKGKKKLHLGSMLPETRIMLNDFYSFYNREMAVLMNDVNFLW